MIALYWFALALIALAIEAFSQQLVLLFVALAAIIAGGLAELLGESAVVLEAIDPVHLTGRVTLHGQDWMARASVPMPKGQTATVVGADGIVLLVEPSSLS